MRAATVDRSARESAVKDARRRFRSNASARLVALTVVLLPCAAARAQQQQPTAAEDPFAGVEEMMVTGSSAGELLNATTTSAIAFDADALTDIGVADVSDLADYVPNLEINSVNATNASFFVRGVGLQDFGANASSSVPIFQDGVPRNPSATQLVGLYDIRAVDVLRGPQSSGNLRNASAGAFIVRTNLPEPEYSGTARMTLSKITSVDARDANRYGFESAMSAPIYEDVVSARIAARYTHENPFWENRCANRTPIADRPLRNPSPTAPAVDLCGERVKIGERSPVPAFLHNHLGEIDDYGVRGQIRIKPADVPLDWVVRAEISALNRDSTLGQHIGTGGGIMGNGDTPYGYRDLDIVNRRSFLRGQFLANDPTLSDTQVTALVEQKVQKELLKRPLDRGPYAGAVDANGRTILDTRTFSTTATYDGEVAETTVNFGFIDYRKSERRDTDLSPNIKFASEGNDQAWEYYGDFSVKGDEIAEVPVGWDVGGYSMIEKVEAVTFQSLFGETQQRNQFEQEIYSWGVYAQGSYEFLEAFTLGAGFRYNWEQKDFDVQNISNSGFFNLTSASSNQRTWDGFTGYVNLEYMFTEDVSAYVKYSRGYKAGHFNPSDAANSKVPGLGFADPESIDAIEFGFNGAAWSNRFTSNGAFFFYNYRDYQVFRLTTNFQGVSRVVQNAEQARNFGAELELALTPLEGFVPEEIEGLRMVLRGGWLEAEFVEFTVTEQRLFDTGTFAIPIDYSGNSLLNSPELQFSGIVTWPVVLDRFGTFTPQYDFSWTDDVPFDPNNGKGEPTADGRDRFPAYALGNRAYMLHNVRLTWAPPGDPGVEVSGWCRNLTDQRYKTFAVDLSTFSGQQLVYVADPRVCGADVRFTW